MTYGEFTCPNSGERRPPAKVKRNSVIGKLVVWCSCCGWMHRVEEGYGRARAEA